MKLISLILAFLGLFSGGKPEVTKVEEQYWFKANAVNLKLIDNTKLKISSAEIATSSGCISGINAFYYDKSNHPLGWLVINSLEVNKLHTSNLLNGFVYIKDHNFIIADKLDNKASFGHQAGPRLVDSYQLSVTNLEDTISDKRSVAIQTEDNLAVFAYFPNATLAELPEKIIDLGKQNGFTVKNAINLDGGNSSSFWNKENKIYETFFSGGWWCKTANIVTF